MKHNDPEYNWLDDPFNDEKAAQELEQARKSKNTGCLILLLAILALIIILSIASCGALSSLFIGSSL